MILAGVEMTELMVLVSQNILKSRNMISLKQQWKTILCCFGPPLFLDSFRFMSQTTKAKELGSNKLCLIATIDIIQSFIILQQGVYWIQYTEINLYIGKKSESALLAMYAYTGLNVHT